MLLCTVDCRCLDLRCNCIFTFILHRADDGYVWCKIININIHIIDNVLLMKIYNDTVNRAMRMMYKNLGKILLAIFLITSIINVYT